MLSKPPERGGSCNIHSGAVPTVVIPEDDPWKLALGRALDGLTGKIANVDVWHLGA